MTGPNGSLGDRWFAQYWFKLDNNFDWGHDDWLPDDQREPDYDGNLANIKLLRLWNPGAVDENFVLATMGYSGGSLQYQTEYVSNPGGNVGFGNTASWAKGVWHLFQFEFKESSVGANDGVFRWWVDGALLVDDRDIKTREDFAQLKRPAILGFYNSYGDAGTDRDDVYLDDAYIDNTWARVEIGNNANYNSCTHREIQIPTDWSAGQIGINLNLGSFEAGSPMYMFVVTSSGQVSSGYLLSGGDAVAPAAPLSLRGN